jgi:hypothetical protein
MNHSQNFFSLIFPSRIAFINADTLKVNSAAIEVIQYADSLNISELKGDTSGMISETAKYFAATSADRQKLLRGEIIQKIN